ncbi:hypothetical protein B0T14DRAFT_188016 [Immersiella caudata]|uniref:Uncharacterized protein n=1 Tax=Immersiella caudata TaxID=314043 RepID=A0AA39WY85_9PEZI|nr:hypothetical protein B0T14DRAFT_188016 [Immersiella caudata]
MRSRCTRALGVTVCRPTRRIALKRANLACPFSLLRGARWGNHNTIFFFANSPAVLGLSASAILQKYFSLPPLFSTIHETTLRRWYVEVLQIFRPSFHQRQRSKPLPPPRNFFYFLFQREGCRPWYIRGNEKAKMRGLSWWRLRLSLRCRRTRVRHAGQARYASHLTPFADRAPQNDDNNPQRTSKQPPMCLQARHSTDDPRK